MAENAAREKSSSDGDMENMKKQITMTTDPAVKKALEDALKQYTEMKKQMDAQMQTPQMKAMMEQAAAAQKKQMEEDAKNDLESYKKEYTEWQAKKDPNVTIKKLLQYYIALVNTVDFNAATHKNTYGQIIFSSPAYESKPANWKQCFRVGKARGNTIVAGALDYAGKDAKIGTIGWCFGGGQSMQAALTGAGQTVACVIYYGMPEENVDRLKTLNCDVLMLWATNDKYINKDVVEKFEANMKTAEKKLTVKAYDAGHGFANPSSQNGYSEEATKDAYKNTLDFFKTRLK